ncbi:MAG: hypothetical protein SWX82_03425 [Cyanobacteriota bacterium]|nr:hypothetical protein [Cyanobacteriota bacterium]
MNNLFDNLANQDGSISDNSGLLNNDDFSSTPDEINQDLNQNLTDNFHQQQQFDYQNFNMGLGENPDLVQNDFSSDNLANQDSGISDNSGLLNNDDLSSTPDEINQDLNQNLTDNFHQQQQFDYQNFNMGLGENPDLVQNNFSSDNLSNQDGSISDNSGLLNNDDFSSTPDEINQDLNQNSTDSFHQQQQFEHQNFGTEISGVNSHALPPEISNFQQEQNNLSLSSHTFENQNIGLSSHRLEFHLEFHSSTAAAYNYDDKYPYTTIDNAGHIDLHTSSDRYGHYVGYLKGRKVYNSGYNYLGYAGTDGKIYDNHNHAVGWVGNNGNIYNEGGIQVSHTNKGVVGGAAYLLCSYYGGAN